MISSSYPSKL